MRQSDVPGNEHRAIGDVFQSSTFVRLIYTLTLVDDGSSLQAENVVDRFDHRTTAIRSIYLALIRSSSIRNYVRTIARHRSSISTRPLITH